MKNFKIIFLSFVFIFFGSMIHKSYATERSAFYLNTGLLEKFTQTDEENLEFGFGTGFYLTLIYQTEGCFGIRGSFQYSYQFGHIIDSSNEKIDVKFSMLDIQVSPIFRFFKEPVKKWDPYATLGIGTSFVIYDDPSAGFNVFGGFGLNYHLNDHLGLHAEVLVAPTLLGGRVLNSGNGDILGVVSFPISIGLS